MCADGRHTFRQAYATNVLGVRHWAGGGSTLTHNTPDTHSAQTPGTLQTGGEATLCCAVACACGMRMWHAHASPCLGCDRGISSTCSPQGGRCLGELPQVPARVTWISVWILPRRWTVIIIATCGVCEPAQGSLQRPQSRRVPCPGHTHMCPVDTLRIADYDHACQRV